ncbi:MAG: SDR family oxidoreductase [Bacteroidales bacterium]
MDFQIKNKLFVVCGATSGFGEATAKVLLNEGAKVICIARGIEKLENLKNKFPQAEILAGDLTSLETIDRVMDCLGERFIDGVFINGGGPPAGNSLETTIDMWDEAYQKIIRWKIYFAQLIVKKMLPQNYGRIVFLESCSVKQVIDNLVLSNSLRMAVVGFAKTLSSEVAERGITVNVLAPGLHDTAAMQRLYKNKSENEHISIEEAKQKFTESIPVKRLGESDEIAVLALWMLSPVSGFVTGQTISHDGGFVRGVFG